MRPKVFINIATAAISGPKKGLLQFLRVGGTEICDPVLVGFSRGRTKKQPAMAGEVPGVPCEALIQRMTYDPRLIPQALRIIKKHDLNILESHGYKSHLLCLILKRLTGLPWVAFVHGWTSENLKMKCYNAMDKVMLGFADKVVVVSRSMTGILNHKWIDRKKIRTIPNAVDPAEYSMSCDIDIRQEYRVDPKAPLLGVIGRFSPEKGHMVLLEAMPSIRMTLPKVKVMFIGDGQEEKRLKKRIDELNLGQSIIFTGFKKELAPFYKAMDLVVIPSFSEGMPNVALEAMLHAKPVVATRVGGVPEVVMDGVTGRIVDPRKSEQLAGAIGDIFRDPDHLLHCGMSGREKVLKDFDPAQRVKMIAELYLELLS